MKTRTSAWMPACILWVFPTDAMSKGERAVGVRGGLSSVTGVLSFEYQRNNLSGSIGILPTADAEGAPPRICFALRWVPKPGKNSIVGSLALATNHSGVVLRRYEKGYHLLPGRHPTGSFSEIALI